MGDMPNECGIHRWILITAPTRRDDRSMRRWRCADCGRWAEAPVSRLHEIQWRARDPKTGRLIDALIARAPLPDQISIFDLDDE